MSAMYELHAQVLQLVAYAENRDCGYRWATVADDLTPGSTIQILTGCDYPMFTLPVLLVDHTLDFDRFTLCPLHRTREGVITRVGDSVRVRSVDGVDAEFCTVSDALGVFA